MTAGDKGSNLRLDVEIQHAHNAGDKRQSDVVPLEGLRRILERLQNPTNVRRVVLVECKKLFQADIAEEVQAGNASNAIGGPQERGVDGGEAPRKKQ